MRNSYYLPSVYHHQLLTYQIYCLQIQSISYLLSSFFWLLQLSFCFPSPPSAVSSSPLCPSHIVRSCGPDQRNQLSSSYATPEDPPITISSPQSWLSSPSPLFQAQILNPLNCPTPNPTALTPASTCLSPVVSMAYKSCQSCFSLNTQSALTPDRVATGYPATPV